MDLILWQHNKLFMVKVPADKRDLLLVPKFCFSPPFCLLNFILSYSTWIIISLLLVFYPHSVHCISSSFVFSFVLIPHNSLAFFPIQQIINQAVILALWHRKIAKSEIHFSSTCLVFCLVMPQVFIIICWLCLPGVFYTVSSFPL